MDVVDLERRRRADAMLAFVELARRLLACRDETRRCALEDRLLTLLPTLHDSGVFDLLDIRDPALRAMLADRGAKPPDVAGQSAI
jgi:hypothetical protein